MLDHARPLLTITGMLDNLLEHGQIDEAKHAELHRLVLARTGRVLDTDPLYPVPNQTTVLSHGTLRALRSDPEVLRKKAAAFERKLQLRWDDTQGSYRLWSEIPGMPLPSQYVAFQQLKLRFEQGAPILAAVVAPAGFGKSELIAAWRCFTELSGACWQAVAVTGVAATQVAGATLHNFLRMQTDGSTAILKFPEERQRLEAVQGIILDEAMMAEVAAVMRHVFFPLSSLSALPPPSYPLSSSLPFLAEVPRNPAGGAPAARPATPRRPASLRLPRPSLMRRRAAASTGFRTLPLLVHADLPDHV